MALVGCTQMAADMSGLLQRMLPKLDDTHLAVCIADSTFGLTPPPHEAAVAKCDFLNRIKTHNRCISILSNTQAKSHRADAQSLSDARSLTTQMHWDRMQSNGFGRLGSNGCGHD